MLELTIVQTYIPEYRAPFFDLLVAALAEEGIRCHVATGRGLAQRAARKDSSPLRYWAREAEPRLLTVRGRTIHLGGSRHIWRQGNGVILSLQGSSLDVYKALMSRPPLRVGLWGHVLPYVTQGNALDLAAERWQMRRADHVFAYGPEGAKRAAMVRGGAAGVTNIMNTVESAQMTEALAGLTDADVERWLSLRRVDGARTLLAYVGGLDAGKGTAFLAGVLDEMWQADAGGHQVLIGGRGDQEKLLQPAADRAQVVLLGRADAYDKAVLSYLRTPLIAPGLIGLMAVDALAMGCPVLARIGERHAPERDYLEEGLSIYSGPSTKKSYSAFLLDKARDPRIFEKLRVSAPPVPQMEDMVLNFKRGVTEMFAS